MERGEELERDGIAPLEAGIGVNVADDIIARGVGFAQRLEDSVGMDLAFQRHEADGAERNRRATGLGDVADAESRSKEFVQALEAGGRVYRVAEFRVFPPIERSEIADRRL